jgi:acetoin utilization protein AcuB
MRGEMKIRDIMTKSVVAVEMDDKLSLVKEIFDNSKFHHLLVIDDGKLFGVVSDRDLLKSISPNLGTMVVTHRDLAPLNKRVHQIMSRKPITLKADNSISDAAALFNTHRISCIPIVDDEFRPVGIISWRDLIKTMLPKPEL